MYSQEVSDEELYEDDNDFYDDDSEDDVDDELEFDTEDDYSVNKLNFEDEDDEFKTTLPPRFVHYCYPQKFTRGMLPTNRMKYEPVDYEDIELKLKCKIGNLNKILQIGTDDCTVLLIYYHWNDQKLLEDYTTQDTTEVRRKAGLSDIAGNLETNLIQTAKEGDMCLICCSESTAENPLNVFHLQHCSHSYCIDCYIACVKLAAEQGNLLINCPEPSCKLKIRPTELHQIDAYNTRILEKLEAEKKQENDAIRLRRLTEDQIKVKYQDDFDDSLDSPDSDDDDDDVQKEIKDEDLFNFHERSLKRQRKEKEDKRKKSLYRNYWYHICKNYIMTNRKTFKSCPAADCESSVEYLGFDSSNIVSIDEYITTYIPIVECTNHHRFCYYCNAEDHAPALCFLVKIWVQTCKDESKTLSWLSANTKDCPGCQEPIEKNGGCNHMTCKSCHHEFCWVCMSDWSRHTDNYNCGFARDPRISNDKEKQEKSRASLTKYLHFVQMFDIHRVSLKKDKEFLSKLEMRVQEIQQKVGVSWIEAQFYRECIDILLKARVTLMWSFAFMYYMNPKSKEIPAVQRLQNILSFNVETLSKLFEVTASEYVIQKKSEFLTTASSVKNHQFNMIDKVMELMITDKNLLSGAL
ncbi:hypothetical protein CANARDRAFT_27531 [[Candida] arabinofermentans NRRL YB-2248]|uniref:RBR-type E3 ubiquitin transferase n=1 Tax=[Candida] arabinofermentans NRRL YB-2248 TaxID=983967 RepID=A0A1E4T3F3_9ASCO|nr:hypothetical protein CANARDRAFT_27531 [[Candida] arabinofermentans NRRL YB-2248]